MGKKKITTIDLSKTDLQDKKKKAIKRGKDQGLPRQGKAGHLVDMGEKALAEMEEIKKRTVSVSLESPNDLSVTEKPAELKTKTEKKTQKPPKQRSKRYKALKIKIDKAKLYSLTEAVELLMTLANSKMDETIEVHLSTLTDKVIGSVNLPYGTGKKLKVIIADEKVLDAINKGKIDFDILIATPQLMPKIARVAKILGPKGLMPNPKTGTISENCEELKKKLETGETRFKTEPKAPLMHMIIGKKSFGKDKILANLEAFIKAVKPSNILRAYLKSTHSPSLKLAIGDKQ